MPRRHRSARLSTPTEGPRHPPPPPDSAASVQQDFASLVVAINGSEYSLDGSLHSVYGFVGNQGTHAGEIRITSNGTLVAHIYRDANGLFSVEVLSAMTPS